MLISHTLQTIPYNPYCVTNLMHIPVSQIPRATMQPAIPVQSLSMSPMTILSPTIRSATPSSTTIIIPIIILNPTGVPLPLNNRRRRPSNGAKILNHNIVSLPPILPLPPSPSAHVRMLLLNDNLIITMP